MITFLDSSLFHSSQIIFQSSSKRIEFFPRKKSVLSEKSCITFHAFLRSCRESVIAGSQIHLCLHQLLAISGEIASPTLWSRLSLHSDYKFVTAHKVPPQHGKLSQQPIKRGEVVYLNLNHDNDDNSEMFSTHFLRCLTAPTSTVVSFSSSRRWRSIWSQMSRRSCTCVAH